MPKQIISAEVLLSAAQSHLGFMDGELLTAVLQPQRKKDKERWLEKGDWLTLAKSVGVESVFFVDQQPVAVFVKSDEQSDAALRELYNRIWCMARPQLLFLARPGELAIYDLSRPPVAQSEHLEDKERLLSEKIHTTAAVLEKLSKFRREEIESGRLFGDSRFADGTHRADRALIRDLRIVRQKLLDKRLPAKYAHALIGRSIFIRYLEDRKVLVPEYFENITKQRQAWQRMLEAPQTLFPESSLDDLLYPRILQDKELTYALFDQLAKDFNGDIFPVDDDERDKVKTEHLELLRSLLLADVSEQMSMFFFAYRFDVIPIELISSIYEEFYNEQKGKSKNHGTHYTPSALVEFILSRTLTVEILQDSPRILDPACGSGIFLVESFRRIVRHQVLKQDGRRLSRPQLRRILRDQIAGIDINEEAIRVAAFSLYLAFLHYQEPREINEQRRLPNLKWADRTNRNNDQHYDILLCGNAFDAVNPQLDPDVAKRFGIDSADVVVGNPPWGYPKKGDELGTKALRRTLDWCNEDDGRIIGDKELSQAFIHLTNELLRKGGRAGLLVSSGILFKHRKSSRQFRRIWLSNVSLRHVVNFSQVRHLFFSGKARKGEAIAPFISIVFEKNPGADTRFAYWSAKRTALIEKTQAVVLSKADMHWLYQRDCLDYEKLWKIYWWGSHRDEALIRSLERFPRLINIPEIIPGARVIPGFGFVEGTVGKKPSGWLKEFKELPIEAFHSYGRLDFKSLREVPNSVERRCLKEVYEGHRLLVRRGIPATGKITARLENRRFCFRHSIFGFRLVEFEGWQEKALLGIFWSSLARYYLFLTTGSWGMWHDELNLGIAGNIPIAFPKDLSLRSKLIAIVDQLQEIAIDGELWQLKDPALQDQIRSLECELDNVIFDLYDLSRAERDLIRDMCDVGLDFLVRNQSSDAVKPILLPTRESGTIASVLQENSGIGAYLRTFLQIWNKDIEPDTELEWKILSPSPQSPVLAVLFLRKLKANQKSQLSKHSWAEILETLDQHSLQTAGSRRIYTDTFVRFANEQEILVIKRNEVRFWTRSAAREDAEATQLQVMQQLEGMAQ